jgi:hypothetical protein
VSHRTTAPPSPTSPQPVVLIWANPRVNEHGWPFILERRREARVVVIDWIVLAAKAGFVGGRGPKIRSIEHGPE